MNATKTQTNGHNEDEAGYIAAPPPRTSTCTSSAAPPASRLPNRKKQAPYALGITVAALALSAAGVYGWSYAHNWVSTNNAYVTGHIHTVSTRIAGNVTQVLVSDNQQVE